MPLPQRGVVALLDKAAGEGVFGGDELMKEWMRDQVEDKRRKAMDVSEQKAQTKNFLRSMMQQQQERQMEEALVKAERDAQLRCQQSEQEERLAGEMERIRLETDRDERIRRQVRENSLELRELETKLRDAYTAKEQKAQMAERQAKDYDEAVREAEITNRMKLETERAEELDKKKEEERYADQIRYQQDLERQMEEIEKKKQEAYEEFLKEKLMVDEVVRKLHEEDQREVEEKLQKVATMKNFIEEFVQARAKWKQQEKDKMEEENKRIAKFALEQRERESRRLASKKEALDRGAQLLQELTLKMMAERDAREEMENAILDLAEEEKELEARKKEREDFENRVRQRLSMQRAYRDAMETKIAKSNAEREEEEEMRNIMMAKFAEDDRIEQMNAQKRRLKQQEHKRQVEKMIMERRSKHEMDKAEEMAAYQAHLDMEKERLAIVEEERQKLIQKHAEKLLGFLPRGVLRDQMDVERLGGEFVDRYSAKKADPFDEDKWEQPQQRLVGSRFVLT